MDLATQLQLLKQQHLLDWKDLLGKSPLKPMGFENLPKYPPSCPFLHQVVSIVFTGRLTFSDFFLEKKAFTDDVSQGEIRKDSLMQGAAACEGDLNMNLLKRNALLQL